MGILIICISIFIKKGELKKNDSCQIWQFKCETNKMKTDYGVGSIQYIDFYQNRTTLKFFWQLSNLTAQIFFDGLAFKNIAKHLYLNSSVTFLPLADLLICAIWILTKFAMSIDGHNLYVASLDCSIDNLLSISLILVCNSWHVF